MTAPAEGGEFLPFLAVATNWVMRSRLTGFSGLLEGIEIRACARNYITEIKNNRIATYDSKVMLTTYH